MKNPLERIPIHVIWLGLFPILALLARNLGQVRPAIAFRAIIFVIFLAVIALFLSRAVLRNWVRAGLFVSLGLLLFFAYGHVYNALRSIEVAGETLGRHRYLLPLWIVLGLSGAFLIYRLDDSSGRLNAALNVGLGIAVLMVLGQIAIFQIGWAEAAATPESFRPEISPTDEQLPDLYYFVLDAYTSNRVLRDSFNLDNSAFLDKLKNMGFYVADCSQANYAQTELSLVSTLNINYLDQLIDETEQDRAQLWPLLRQSVLRHLLEGLGYEIIAFETGYYWSEWEDADRYLAPDSGLFRGMSAFEATLLRSTAAWALIDALPELPGFLVRDLDRSTDSHRQRLQFVFNGLAEVSTTPGPKFVFAHIVSPHRPFVFDAEGNPVEDNYDWGRSNLGPEVYKEGYKEQVMYLNREIEAILAQILEGSETPPLIVIQGDHGPEEGSASDRMSILNAIYLGGEEVAGAHKSITPVNVFRLLLSEAFNADTPQLEDISYYSIYEEPFDYSSIANECP